jgi:hypothetical protein
MNHRLDLASAVLIKDNHLAAVDGDVGFAVRRARELAPAGARVEVECDTRAQVEAALEAGADVVMLDNMALDEMRACVQLCEGRAITEASGGVRLDTVRAIAETGVDWISVGALTHSPRRFRPGARTRVRARGAAPLPANGRSRGAVHYRGPRPFCFHAPRAPFRAREASAADAASIRAAPRRAARPSSHADPHQTARAPRDAIGGSQCARARVLYALSPPVRAPLPAVTSRTDVVQLRVPC